MAQASLSPDYGSVAPPNPSADAEDVGAIQRHGPTLWLFGLTAMTLVFASLLLLGLLARSAIVDPTVRDAVNAYTMLTATVGLVAMTYVLAMARKAGFFGSSRTSAPALHADPETEGLLIAPTVPASVSPHLLRKTAVAQASRAQQARAISAAAIPRPPWPAATAPVRPPAPVAPHLVMPAQTWSQRPPGAAPAFLRMSPPPMHPHAQPAAFQVWAASRRPPLQDRTYQPTISDRLLGRVPHPPYPQPVSHR